MSLTLIFSLECGIFSVKKYTAIVYVVQAIFFWLSKTVSLFTMIIIINLPFVKNVCYKSTFTITGSKNCWRWYEHNGVNAEVGQGERIGLQTVEYLSKA